MARQLFEITAGEEGPEHNMFGNEYIVSIAAAGPTLVSESDDYGIWTSESGPSSADLLAGVETAVERKKAA
jgi:hypothetical protein